MRRPLALLAAVLAVMLVSGQALAEKRIALVIGNGDYAFSPLPNPKNDAKLMARTLRGLDFEVIETLDADQKAMKTSIKAFGKKLDTAGREGVGLFFYAGHGVQVKGANYLIPTDAQIETEGDVDIDAINAQSVLSMMEFSGARLSFVIMDACRDNPFKRSFRSGSRGLAKMEAPTGSLIAYATAPGDVAADGTGANSPYTMALSRMMNTPGLPVERMFREVRNSVRKETNNKQTPWESSSLVGGDFYFKGGASSESTSLVPATPLPPSGVEFSIDDLQKQQETQEKWERWQRQMRAAFQQANSFTGKANLKRTAWDRFLSSFGKDNPLSNEDETLRATAKSRRAAIKDERVAVVVPPPMPSSETNLSITVREVERLSREAAAKARTNPGNGYKVVTYSSGDRYEGEYRDNKRNGWGVYTYANGNRHEGKYRDGKVNGLGVKTYSNGDRYEGDYRDDKRNGWGVYTYASGARHEGEYQDGKANGRGVYKGHPVWRCRRSLLRRVRLARREGSPP